MYKQLLKHKNYSLLLFFSLILFTIALSNSVHKRWNLSADMASVLPNNDKSSDIIQHWSNTEKKDFEKKVSLILQIPNEQLEVLNETVISAQIHSFEQRNKEHLTPYDHYAEFSSLTQELLPYRFNITSPISNPATIQQLLQAQLFSAGHQRLPELNFLNDPLASFSSKLLGFLGDSETTTFGEYWGVIDTKSNTTNILISYELASNGFDLTLQEDLRSQVDKLQHSLQKESSNIRVLRIGPLFHAEYAASNMKRDITTIAGASTLAIVVMFWFVFRRWKPLLMSTLSISYGIAASFVICNYIFNELHIIVMVFGAALIGVSADYSIHFHCKDHACAINKTKTPNRFTEIQKPLVLSLLSSVIAYLCLAFSGLSILVQVASFSSIGLIAALFFLSSTAKDTATVELPNSLFPGSLKLIEQIRSRYAGQKKNTYRFLLFVLITGLALLPVSYEYNDNPRLMYQSSEELIADALEANRISGNYDPSQALLIMGNTDALVLNKLDSIRPLLDNLKSQNLLQGYSSIVELVPPIDEQRRNFEASRELYAKGGILETLLRNMGFNHTDIQSAFVQANSMKFTPLEPSKLNSQSPLVSRYWLSHGETKAAVVLLERPDPQHLQEAIEKLNDESIVLVSRIQNIRSVLETIRKNAQAMMLFAYIGIFALFTSQFGWKKAFSLLSLPFGVSVICLLYFSILGRGVSSFTIFGLYLVLGLGIDYAIFYQRQNVLPSDETVLAILLSGFTSLLSFGLLGFSSTPMIRDFGQTLALGTLLNVLVVMILVSVQGTSSQARN